MKTHDKKTHGRPSPVRKLFVILPVLALAGALVVLVTRPGESQPSAPDRLVVGIYSPTVEFGTAQARLAYAQGLARAIESNTGIRTDAAAFASLSALRKGDVDYAIVDGQCYATNLGWRLIANANVSGSTSRNWALYSSVGPDMMALRGKKLAFVQMGCNDNGFLDNAMLESEVDSTFFSSRVGKPDLTAAIAEVASYKGAQAVFAPVGSQKGLTKVFETGTVPNPAFVQINTRIPAGVTEKVASTVVGYGGSGAIAGWSGPNRGAYQGLAGRMARVIKKGIFAVPEPVRFEAKDVLVEPETIDDTALTEVKQHFERPPERME